MKYVAVKFYSQFPNSIEMQQGIDPTYPAEVVELHDFASFNDPNYTIMGLDNFINYKNSKKESYLEWYNSEDRPWYSSILNLLGL